MLRAKKSIQSFHKNNKILTIVLGGLYTFYGLFQLGVVNLQQYMFSKDEFALVDNPIMDNVDMVFQNIFLMMPYLIAIGIGFIVFGLFYKSVKPYRLIICYLLIGSCVVWSLFYINASVGQLTVMYDNIDGAFSDIDSTAVITKFSDAGKFIGIMGLVTSFIYMVAPIIILTLRIKLNDEES